VTEPSDADRADQLGLQRQIDTLSRRFAALSDRLLGLEGPSVPVAAESLEELSTSIEELEVAAEELFAQTEALTAVQQELNIEVARYRELFDLAPDGYLVTDTNGIIQEANRAASELLGAPEALLNSKPIVLFVDETERRLVLDSLSSVITKPPGSVIDLEPRLAPPGLPAFPCSMRLTATAALPGGKGDRIRWLIRDISKRVGAERAQAASEARYRLIADNATDVIITSDDSGRITYASPSTRAILGWDADTLKGEPLLNFVHPGDRPALIPIQDEVALGGHVATATFRVRSAGGRYLPMDARIGPLVDPMEGTVGTSAALRDVREREEARIVLQATLAREREAAAALRQADATKDALLLAVGHDLRSPVAAAVGLADILADKYERLSESDLGRIARGLAFSTHQLNTIVTNLLDVERVVGGYVTVQRHPTDLAAIIATSAERAGLTTTTAELPTGPAVVDIDPGLTERIVDNLLTNAARHAPPDTVVRVGIAPDEDSILLTVDDEGPGVPDHLKDTIFEAFQRQPGATGVGLGLGLYLVRRFAELQGGRAWVENGRNGGASFRVRFPVRTAT
jgi:PAS domain S-box-containing protein